MMTYEEVMELLATVDADLSVWEYSDGSQISVTVEDFEGFDDNWDEVYRDYDEEAIDAVYETLCKASVSVEGDFYRYLHFDGFTVVWGYASFDI